MIVPDKTELALWRDQLDTLSPSEQEVVSLMADGYRATEIAKRRALSYNTIKTHIRNAYSKLGVDSQIQLVAIVWKVRYDELKKESVLS